MALTQVDQGLLGTYAQYTGFKNRIINGAMVIDQRNAGASVTINTDAKNYVMDRFWAFDNTEGVFTLQQVTDAPAGFINSAKATVTTADSSITNDQYSGFSQLIEGLNCADLAWGTASASTITLSFWVKSSLTGTFGGSLRNNAADRSYPFTYTITSANTWEQKSITIAGDTSGTWLTTNGIGIRVQWSIAEGPNRVGTAGAWASANYAGATGQTQIISTLNATWQITGVQLEKGSTATSFDYRPYTTELQLCQRYFEILGATNNSLIFQTYAPSIVTGGERVSLYYKAVKRTTPTATVVGTWIYSNGSGLSFGGVGVDCSRVEWTSSSSGVVTFVYNGNSGAYLSFSAEL